jgi:lysophospholipase L1-like esterase
MTELEKLEKELLEEIQEEPEIYADTEEFCTINPETRIITVPTSKRILGTESDQETNRLYFKCPKVVGDNIDLSLFSLRINYQNAGNKKDQYLVEDVKEEGDNITFSWLLKRNATAYKGNVKFILCAVKTTEDGIIKNEWNTTLNTECESLEGMEVDKVAVEEETKDIVEQLIAMMNHSAENAVRAVEEAKAEVDKEVGDFALKTQQALADVNNAGQAQTERVQTAGNDAVESIKAAQGTAARAVETAKTEAIEAVQTEGTTQAGNVSAEGEKQVQAVRGAAQEIMADREQIQMNKEGVAKLKEDIREIDKIKKYIEVDADEVVDGALINLDNKTLHNLHPNCYIKQIIPGNIKSIKVSGKSVFARWGFSLCGCYKEDGSLISKFGNDDNTVYTDLLIEIPNECAYVYINQAENSAEKYKKIKFFTISNLTTDVENLKTNVSDLTTDVSNLKKKINVDLNFNKIGYIEPISKEPFYVVSNGDGFRTDYIPTEGYKKIKYDLKGDMRYIYLIAFFDENKKFLRDETQSIITKNADTISIPENAKYVVASTYSSSVVNGTASLINNNSLDEKITKLDSRITKIESIGIYGDSEFALFKKFGIVGDSLSVGHTVSKDGQTALGRNIYWSWGQYMARRLGNICLNFGRSGVTSKLWLNPSEQYCYPRLIDKANLCQAYIVALGANDTQAPLGSISDVNFTDMSLNADTEYGNYAKIIDTIQKTAPKAPIFLCTIPHPRNSDINIQAINNMIREFASESRFTGVYLVDLDAEYNEYYKTGKLGDEIRNTGWHLTSLGYLYDSFVRQRALSQVVADNCAEFQDVFLLPVGTNNELD